MNEKHPALVSKKNVPLHDNVRVYRARTTPKKKFEVWLVFSIRHIHLILHQQIITFDCYKMLWWRKFFPMKIRLNGLLKTFSWKPEEFYSKESKRCVTNFTQNASKSKVDKQKQNVWWLNLIFTNIFLACTPWGLNVFAAVSP